MSVPLDLTGQRFGRLTAKYYLTKTNTEKPRRHWVCGCDCGAETTVDISHLRSGHTRSCGCLLDDRKWPGSNGYDLRGERFGRLVALEYETKTGGNKKKRRKRYWVCQCDCGQQISVETSPLVKGYTQSCGCIINEKRLNQRFGKLTAVERMPAGSGGTVRWRCVCDCGNEKIMNTNDLSVRKVFDCGCGAEERKRKAVLARSLPSDIGALRQMWRDYKYNAKSRGRSWELTAEHLQQLVFGDCYYCGSPPSRQYKPEKYPGDILVNGVDRVDSSRGYESDNVVSCCWWCNFMKRDMLQDDFIEHCRKIVEYQDLLER